MSILTYSEWLSEDVSNILEKPVTHIIPLKMEEIPTHKALIFIKKEFDLMF
jgi:hypothetical protein